MTKPACFPSQKMFDDWKKLARHDNEDSHPCHDCTPVYKAAMGRQCEQAVVQVMFLVPGRSSILAAQKAAREGEVAKKAAYDAKRAKRANQLRRARQLKATKPRR